MRAVRNIALAAVGGDRACRRLQVITYCLGFTTILAAGFALRAAAPILLPAAYAFVIGLLLRPSAKWLDRRGVPEQASAAVLTGAVIGLLVAAIYFGGRPAIQWFDSLPEVVDRARDKLEGLQSAYIRVNEVTESVEEIAAPENNAREVVVREKSLASAAAASAQTFLIQFTLVGVFLYFFLATRKSSRRKMLALRSSFRTRLQSARIAASVERNVIGYMLTMLAINTGLGVCVGIGIALVGGSTPIVFGVLAGILNFVPYLGPTIMNLLLAATGLVEQENLLMALAPLGVYFVLNMVESNFVTPSLIGARSRTSPLAIIVAIALFTWLWGPFGAVVAIPLLLILKTLCDHIGALKAIGILLSEDVGRRGRGKSSISSGQKSAEAARANRPVGLTR